LDEIILVRHGHTIFNEQGRYQGQMDTELSQTGLKQAAAVARRLQRENISAVYSSDLRRAGQTARIIARACDAGDVIYRADLRERRFGAWEGSTLDEIMIEYPELARQWLERRSDVRPPNGETFAELRSRAAKSLECIRAQERMDNPEVDSPAKVIVVVSHGGLIRALLTDILNMHPKPGVRLRVDNGSITRIAFSDRSTVIVCLNDTSHLPADSALTYGFISS